MNLRSLQGAKGSTGTPAPAAAPGVPGAPGAPAAGIPIRTDNVPGRGLPDLRHPAAQTAQLPTQKVITPRPWVSQPATASTGAGAGGVTVSTGTDA
jgi:hypothetical protein